MYTFRGITQHEILTCQISFCIVRIGYCLCKYLFVRKTAKPPFPISETLENLLVER